MKVIFDHSNNETANIITFWFKSDGGLDYLAGQFVELTLPDHENNTTTNHWFTLSSSPSDLPFLSITTRLSDNASSFKKTLKGLKKGVSVDISEPTGDFVLPKDLSVPLIFIASGIGVTPFHSIVRWLSSMNEPRHIKFIYYVKDANDIIFRDNFNKYALEEIDIVSSPDKNWTGETGRINGKRILSLTRPDNRSLIYIAGPEEMTESLNSELLELGIDRERIIGDYFPGYSKF